MILFKKSTELRNWVETQHQNGKTTGFVPTMGALHAGHLSLVEAARRQNDLALCSIFVNPAQFNDKKDFDKYPVTIETDIKQLLEAGTDVLFLPTVDELYPGGSSPDEHYALGYIETILEGSYRPGHFQGVCMVVKRLLETVNPDRLYLGQKDLQQCLVITKLVELLGLSEKIKIEVSPTLREENGLAMSSRNMRFSAEEKERASIIYQTLLKIKENIQPGNLAELKREAIASLEQNGFKVDYVEIASATDLWPVDQWDGEKKIVALVAAFLNGVRLIDNQLL